VRTVPTALRLVDAPANQQQQSLHQTGHPWSPLPAQLTEYNCTNITLLALMLQVINMRLVNSKQLQIKSPGYSFF